MTILKKIMRTKLKNLNWDKTQFLAKLHFGPKNLPPPPRNPVQSRPKSNHFRQENQIRILRHIPGTDNFKMSATVKVETFLVKKMSPTESCFPVLRVLRVRI